MDYSVCEVVDQNHRDSVNGGAAVCFKLGFQHQIIVHVWVPLETVFEAFLNLFFICIYFVVDF